MSKQRVGVVGYGFVGEAVALGLSSVADVVVWDIDPDKGLFLVEECVEGWTYTAIEDAEPYRELIDNCAIIFVCVPTPMKEDGSCNISTVGDVLDILDRKSLALEPRPTVVIKSTVPPGTTAMLQKRCSWIDLVFNPEFLTEANSQKDFADQDRVILGGAGLTPGVEKVAILYREFGLARQARLSHGSSVSSISPGMPAIQICTSTEAEMIKYLTNCFLATKVSLANEFSQLCEKVGANWDTVWTTASKDERLGRSHWRVPGPDGKVGFGGSCFPKEMCGMIAFMRGLGIEPWTLIGAWYLNTELRPEYDWTTPVARED